MAVFKVEHNKNYTVMSNQHFRERKMSLKAKGLLSLMLSLPEDWDYSIAGLVSICKENETAIKSTLKELSEFGYLRIDKIYPDKTDTGRIEYIYNVFENPIQEGKKQGVENLPVEIQGVENQVQLNTKKENTKKLNKNNKYRILQDLPVKTLEYDLDEDILTLLEEFYTILIDNKKIVSAQKIEADLSNIAKVSKSLQVDTIKTAMARGWQSLNPEWITNSQNKGTRIEHSCNAMSQEEHLAQLDEMRKNCNHKF